jgi:hypothetical protein
MRGKSTNFVEFLDERRSAETMLQIHATILTPVGFLAGCFRLLRGPGSAQKKAIPSV